MPGPYVSTEPTSESPEAKAIRLLNRQLGELQTVRGLNHLDPKFQAWRITTLGVLERFLGKDSHHTAAFRYMDFSSREMIIAPFGASPPPDYISPKDTYEFKAGCEATDELLRAAIREVEDFGVHVEEAKPAKAGRGKGGGVSQHFSADTMHVTQAVAADSAVQRINHLGNKTGADLKEISNLLQQSQDLSPNQVRQGVADVEALAVEVEKPEEKRNWKTVLEYGQRVLELAGKAVDLGTKLGPHLPTVVALVEAAKHALK
jgi:hypothetical protein